VGLNSEIEWTSGKAVESGSKKAKIKLVPDFEGAAKVEQKGEKVNLSTVARAVCNQLKNSTCKKTFQKQKLNEKKRNDN
jgi:hypothetical protein